MTNQDENYLSKDFDCTKLTIPRIKKILIENGITEFPPRAKKNQLIEIFKENIEAIRQKKKEANKSKNIYQEERSSIIELEVNENDQKGGQYTSGRNIKNEIEKKKEESNKQNVKYKQNIKYEQNVNDKQNVNNKQNVYDKQNVNDKQNMNDKQNVSFLESLAEHLRGTSKRRQRNEDIKKQSQPTQKRPQSPVKKVIVDVDSGVSDTSFFSSQISKDSTPRKKKVITTPPLSTSRSLLYTVALPFLLVLVSLCIYKVLPYCTNGDLLCLSVPKNGKLINGKIVCDEGFRLKRTFFSEVCLKDETKETRMLKKIHSIVKQLEILKGDYHFGLVKSFKMNLSHFTTDNELIEILKHTPGVVVSDGMIYATKYRTTIKALARHYSTKAFYFLVFLLIFLIIFHLIFKYRRTVYERKASSQKIAKEILNILLRQLVISSKNSRFPGFVFVDHLKDVFVVERKIWEMVKKSVESNSNVRKGEVDNKETWEWIGPFIQSTESIESLL